MTLNKGSLLLNSGQRLFVIAVLFLSGLSLLAIWYPRFPAMQDYPQHLFTAYVISTFEGGIFNWSDYYYIEDSAGPYSLFFLIVVPLAKLLPIEIAGKVYISLVLGLIVALVFVWNFAREKDYPSWSLLLLFPVFFSQMYYMGFTNYLISIPILFFILFVHERVTFESINKYMAAAYLLLMCALFLSHPYSILVYIVLASAISICNRKNKVYFYKSLVGPLVAAIIFVLWYVATFSNLSALMQGEMDRQWLPLNFVLGFFVMPLFGMRMGIGIDYITAFGWVLITAIYVYAWHNSKAVPRAKSPVKIMLLLTISGYLILPFYFNDYSYFNLRMSLVCYFLIALALGNIKLGRNPSFIMIMLVTGLMLQIINTQVKLSGETEELLPLLDQMEINSAVYTIYENASANAIDREYFYQFHSHDHFYYHTLVGGGVTPKLFPSKMNRVKFKDGITMPDIAAAPHLYRYILVRGEGDSSRTIQASHTLKASSASWSLYERHL
ncbi:MAG: hypothetical protein JKY98_10340 [Gammaproteobacteria bacterium]|nr:hypothetical protein [Gammaproteobacteria bacterium]